MKSKLFVLLALIALIYSCGTGTSNKEVMLMEQSSYDAATPPPPAEKRELATEQATDRKIIKTGDIRFQSRNLQETENLIISTVNELEGYIANNNTYNSEDRISQNITVRVPAHRFDALLEKISSNARKIDYKNIHTQDVTEEFIDIEARLRTKKELEARYLELLKKAVKVEEIVAIEKELGALRADIESIEGRLKYLSNQVNMSTLTIEFYQLTGTTLNFSSKIGNALVAGWRLLLAFLVGLVNLWPFILIMLVVLFWFFRVRRKRAVNAQLKN